MEWHFMRALRFMERYPDALMSCANGDGWKLYMGYGERTYFGYHKQYKYIARVCETPNTTKERDKYHFWGNYWGLTCNTN